MLVHIDCVYMCGVLVCSISMCPCAFLWRSQVNIAHLLIIFYLIF